LATKILLVDDEPNALVALAKILSEDGYDVVMAGTEEQALAELGHSDFGFIITDLFLLRKRCMKLFKKIEGLEARTPVILASGRNDVDRYVAESRLPDVMRLSKPIEYEKLKRLLEDTDARGKEVLEAARR
jgi:DNA-binding NtrC family response regulator